MLGTTMPATSLTHSHLNHRDDSFAQPSPQTMPIFLVHPGAAERRRLAAILETTKSPIREYGSAGELVNSIERGGNGCLVCDSDLGGSSGLHLIAQLHAMGVLIPTVMLVSPGDVHGAVAAMKAGVGEIVVKPVEPGELLHALRAAIDTHRGSGASRETVAELLRRQSRLSNRELTVFRLITRGLSNKETAQEMALAVKTIEIHRANVMKKMEAASLADLVRQAVVLEGTNSPLTERVVPMRR